MPILAVSRASFMEELIFWAASGLLVYTYVGYPLLIWAWARLRQHRRPRASATPAVSILVVAHNEAERIAAKIENLLALDYPRECLEIVVASDASTDATVPIARRYEDRGVRVVAFDEHRGKPAVLNELVPRLRGEIAVLMDVRQRIEPRALRELVADFADPDVGAVSGELLLEGGDGDAVAEGVGFYWRYEKFIRHYEGQVDSTVGTTGALYALRRALFMPIPNRTLIDDVLIPMQIVRQGYRVLFEPSARAWDRVAASPEQEFTRKVRTIAGNFQLLFREPWLLNPFSNRLWFQTLSHKFFRLVAPLCLVLAWLSNLTLLDQPLYRVTMALQLFFYCVALAGQVLRNPRHKTAVMKVAYAFCLLNWATVVGFLRFVSGRQQVTWKRG